MKAVWRLWRTVGAAYGILLIVCVLMAGVLMAACMLRWRAPASGVECQYLTAALHARRVMVEERTLALPWLHGHFTLGNTSLVGNVFTLPLLCAVPGRQSMLWASTIAMSMITVMLLAVLVRRLLAPKQRGVAGTAALAAGTVYLFAPLSIISAVSFTATAPAALCMVLALLAYQSARRCATPAAWLGASCVMLLSWYAKPEWGIVFIPAMLIIYCVDEWMQRGWRDGAAAVCTMAGIAPLAIAAFHPWRADTGSLIVMLLIVGLAGVWLLWLHAGGVRARRTLAFALPAACGVITWLLLFDNGAAFLNLIRQPMYAHHDVATRLVYVRQQWAATLSALVIVAGLCVAGMGHVARRWPGLVVLGLALGYAAVRVPCAPQIQALTLFVIIACCAGAGAAVLCVHAERLFKRILPERFRAAVVCAVIVCVCLPGLPRALRDDFVPGTQTRVPLFDRSRAGWQVLAYIIETVPRGAACAYTPATPALSHLALDAYARLYDLEWDVQPWPQERAAATLPDYLILAMPGGAPSARRYFSDPGLPEYCAAQRAALDADARCELVAEADIAEQCVQLRVYRARTD